jgi:hypothetical protein
MEIHELFLSALIPCVLGDGSWYVSNYHLDYAVSMDKENFTFINSLCTTPGNPLALCKYQGRVPLYDVKFSL